MTNLKIRDSFLDFFRNKDHTIVPSMSLIPKDDPSLLFTSAGMVQFKPLWSGSIPLLYKRAASVQKCLRLSDLDNVGRTRRHLTFFEMLGNFSFGDYFKEEAIIWAWEYLIDVLGIDKTRLYITVHRDDDEAYNIWHGKIGLKTERIYKLGDDTNFWGPAGNSGPCGPCSEIYFDLGEKFSCGKQTCAPGCDCDRFGELWNLVFPQFNQSVSGERLPLKNRGIDTGLGFERLVLILQNEDSPFLTDLFHPIIKAIAETSKRIYGKEPMNDTSMNVIADHCRALVFAIGDGIIPSNEERGYVLRRLLRRAVRLARNLKIEGPSIYRLVPVVVDIFKFVYPELMNRREEITLIIKSEEERFLETLEKGLLHFEAIHSKNQTISGNEAFELYDTYGFPLELTVEIASERGAKVDEKGFYEILEQAREFSRTKAKFAPKGEWKILHEGNGMFIGYEKDEIETDILRYCLHDKNIDLVLKESPFYAESGGQAGEVGTIIGKDFRLEVLDTYYFQGMAVCHCQITEGKFTPDRVTAAVNKKRRKESARAHTATHLLHAALRKTLGEHARQEGSSVEPGRFRFDFTHFKPLNDDEIDAIENLVNEKVLENIPVQKFYTNLEEAKKMGAMALFGEKYSENVRVVRIGDFSIELCGGMHLEHTGEIGMFKIVSQESAAAGIRRIEAIVGTRLFEDFRRKDKIFRELAGTLGTDVNLADRVNEIQQQLKELEKANQENRVKLAQIEAKKLLEKVVKGKQHFIMHEFKNFGFDGMRLIADSIRDEATNIIGVFYEEVNGKVNYLVFVSANLLKDHPANKLIKEISKIWGGGGGGKPYLAEGGGADPKKVREVANYLQGLLKKK